LVDAGFESKRALLIRFEVLNAVHGLTNPNKVLLLVGICNTDGLDHSHVNSLSRMRLRLLLGLKDAVDRSFFKHVLDGQCHIYNQRSCVFIEIRAVFLSTLSGSLEIMCDILFVLKSHMDRVDPLPVGLGTGTTTSHEVTPLVHDGKLLGCQFNLLRLDAYIVQCVEAHLLEFRDLPMDDKVGCTFVRLRQIEGSAEEFPLFSE
jgi:hypothetical protein